MLSLFVAMLSTLTSPSLRDIEEIHVIVWMLCLEIVFVC